MKDPFQVLGISPTASEDEIKTAYRKLARLYHPDLHPGDKAAEEQMKEVNDAYTEALRVKKTGSYNAGNYGEHAGSSAYGRSGYGGYSGYGYGGYGGQSGPQAEWDPFGFGGFWGYAQQQSQQQRTSYARQTYDDPELQAAADYIVSGRYGDALGILNRVTAHDAAWHYLCALAKTGAGARMDALSHARQAVQMEPDNMEYRRLLQQLQGPGQQYRQAGGSGGFGDLICANPFLSCITANLLCSCLCGGRMMFCC